MKKNRGLGCRVQGLSFRLGLTSYMTSFGGQPCPDKMEAELMAASADTSNLPTVCMRQLVEVLNDATRGHDHLNLRPGS